jgi:hypothetical protein
MANSFIWQVSGVGGTTQHYLGNSPRAYPGVFHGYSSADANAYDREHEFPFTYPELVSYYEWVEQTLPVETAAMGKKEQAFLEAAGAMGGLVVQRSKDTTADSYRPQENAILQPRGLAGRTSDPQRLVFPAAFGCTFCGHCVRLTQQPHAIRVQYTDLLQLLEVLVAGRGIEAGVSAEKALDLGTIYCSATHKSLVDISAIAY